MTRSRPPASVPPGARRPLGEGAAQAAPTAPHATPRAETGPSSGPERFWARRPAQLAFAAALALSLAAHLSTVPLGVPPEFAVNDVEGEAAIPIDVLEQDEPPPPPPEPAPSPVPVPTPTPSDDDRARELAARARADAGAPRDAAPDAAPDARPDAAADAAPRDAGSDGAGWDGMVALASDSGSPSEGPRDPSAIVGAAGDIQADVVLVMLLLNAEVIRAHPEGASLGALLRAVPQWDQFMTGTDIDPVKDVDWLMISGPSLINTSRDVVLVRMSATDARIDKAMDTVAARYAKGGGFDAGAPGVRAVRSFADGSERVVMRPRPHVVAVVPPQVAPKIARQLSRAGVPAHVRKGEAAYLRLVNPRRPMPQLPEGITELRLRIVPREDQGVDVLADFDVKDAESAPQAARGIEALVRSLNTMMVSVLTHGVLNGVEVSSEGAVVHARVTASRDHIATLIALAGSFLGAPAGSPRPAPSSR